MSKGDEFLLELKNRLAHLPITETGKVLSYYSESLQDRIEDGMTEEEAIKSFESIYEIVKNLEEEIPLSAVVKDKVISKTTKNKNMTAATIVITIFAVILTSPIWIILLAVLFSIAVAVVAVLWSIPIIIVSIYVSLYPVAISGIFFGFTRMFTVSFSTGLAYLGVGVASAGLAIMLLMPIVVGLKGFLKINIYPFKKLKQWLIRKG